MTTIKEGDTVLWRHTRVRVVTLGNDECLIHYLYGPLRGTRTWAPNGELSLP